MVPGKRLDGQRKIAPFRQRRVVQLHRDDGPSISHAQIYFLGDVVVVAAAPVRVHGWQLFGSDQCEQGARRAAQAGRDLLEEFHAQAQCARVEKDVLRAEPPP